MDELAAIVIDNGSDTTKAGFAGDDAPSTIFQSIVGKTKQENGLDKYLQTFVGEEAILQKDNLELKYPMERGVVVNFYEMDEIWRHTFKSLKVDPKDRKVLLTEPSLNPKSNREGMLQSMFERFSVGETFVSTQALLSHYSLGRNTSVTIESGDGVTTIVPITEGYAIEKAIKRIELGGKDVTDYLMKCLIEKDVNLSLNDYSDRELVKQLKEKYSYITLNFDEELTNKNEDFINYELPDGKVIKLGSERFKCTEILFQPYLIGLDIAGIHEVLFSSIIESDLDIRRYLYGNIAVTGGNTLMDGIAERLTREIVNLAPAPMKIKVIAPNERKYATWVGGSILASLSSFEQMWISKEEYEDCGPTIVHKKCF